MSKATTAAKAKKNIKKTTKPTKAISKLQRSHLGLSIRGRRRWER